ncbi:MAG: hypothetical protein ACRELY_08685, partial [Polyangiaceae bacterium]
MRALPILLTCSLATLALACGDNARSYPEPGPSGSVGGGGSGSNAQPLLVDVDTGKTMTAAPGEGVGIFVEYKTGGHWHVSWTCDTNKTKLGCTFSLQLSSVTGQIANLAINGQAQGDNIQQTDNQTITATTSTTSNAVDITFDADAGGKIQINADVGGVQDSSFFFFVQDGQVNG